MGMERGERELLANDDGAHQRGDVGGIQPGRSEDRVRDGRRAMGDCDGRRGTRVSATGDDRFRDKRLRANSDRAHRQFVNSAAFSPDGQKIVTASDDQTVWGWNVVTGKCAGNLNL